MLPLMYGWAGLGRSINIVIYFQDKETVSSVSTTVLLPQIITHCCLDPVKSLQDPITCYWNYTASQPPSHCPLFAPVICFSFNLSTEWPGVAWWSWWSWWSWSPLTTLITLPGGDW